MYKCKECGAEYEEKPDYCDCGNDEFIQSENVKEADTATEIKENIKVEPKPAKVKPTSSFGTQNSVPKKQLPLVSVDSISLTVFLICILLSLYVVFFAWNPNDTNIADKEQKTQEKIVEKQIPPIDKFWNNVPPVVKVEPVKQEDVKPVESVTNVVKQIIPTVKPVAPKKTETPKMTTVQLKKTSAANVKHQPKTVTVNNNVQKQTAQEDLAKKKAEQERLAAETEQIKKLQAEQAKKSAEEKAKRTELEKQEFQNYKAQLRNTIGRKIDFTRVIGDGFCTVAFKIDSNGRLVNRSFAKQSSNNTLNDAVYNAVMATPSFNPPPSGYNNETLNLNIKFYNGNFEISLP